MKSLITTLVEVQLKKCFLGRRKRYIGLPNALDTSLLELFLKKSLKKCWRHSTRELLGIFTMISHVALKPRTPKQTISCLKSTVNTLKVVNYFNKKLLQVYGWVLKWRRSGVFILNFKHISHLFLVFLLLTLNRQLFVRSSLGDFKIIHLIWWKN